MKILLGILGLTVGLASLLFGQETQAVSADVRSQVEAVFLQFQSAYNTRDAEGIAATVTQDAVDAVLGRAVNWKTSGGRAFSAGFQRESRQNGEHDPADVSGRTRWGLRDCRLACRHDALPGDDPLCAFGQRVEIEDGLCSGAIALLSFAQPKARSAQHCLYANKGARGS